jgi:hypothetical protein
VCRAKSHTFPTLSAGPQPEDGGTPIGRVYNSFRWVLSCLGKESREEINNADVTVIQVR